MDDAAALPLRERLASEIGICQASDLQAHVKRGAVIVVAEQLDLLEAALAVATDSTASVQSWIATAKLHAPTADTVRAWEASPAEPLRSVIVSPFVLVQTLKD
jgi:hypothetical protein